MLSSDKYSKAINMPSFQDLGIDKARILRVIESLRVNGNEVHPGSVALELGIPRTYIYENLELLELVYSGMEKSFGHDKLILELIKERDKLLRKVKKIQKDLDESENNNKQSFNEGFSKGASLNYEKDVSATSDFAFGKELWARSVLYLDLNKELDQAQIKKSYRRLANLLHPDKTGEDTAEIFKHICEASDYLLSQYN